MNIKKYFKLLTFSLFISLGLGVLSIEISYFFGNNLTIAYAKKKNVKKKKVKKKSNKRKKYKKVLKIFTFISEGLDSDEGKCYVDSKNNKIYIKVDDFFNELKGTSKEAYIKVKAGKKSVTVKTDKKYKDDFHYYDSDMPNKIYGKPIDITFYIDKDKISVKGYVVKNSYYWSKDKYIFVDFDELAQSLDLIAEKDIVKRKCLLFTKLPENQMELKPDKSPLESYNKDNTTEINYYDINGRWASPIKNYLYEEDGNLVRVENLTIPSENDDDFSTTNKLTVKRYDNSGNLIDTKEIACQGEQFGGFFRGEENNYIIFGNTNVNNDDGKEVLRIVKYDRNFNELAALSVNGAYTAFPFDAGSLRCAEIGQTILVHTSRKRYDGHQSQLTVAFNEDTMSLLNADNLGEFQRNHVSHDFNEFVMADGNEFITVDHGDAYPRSILVSWLRTVDLLPFLGKSYTYYNAKKFGLFSISNKVDILNIPGKTGANQTGVSIGSTLNTGNKILVGVNQIDYSKAVDFDSFDINGKDVDKRNVILYSLDKNTKNVTENKYTDYSAEKDVTYTAPKMIRLDDTRIMLIWNKINNKSYDKFYEYYEYTPHLQYLIVDENGNKLSEINTIEGMKIADEAPILYNGKVVWSEYKKGRLILNTIAY